MGQTFNDHFAAVATSYADFRPTYPAALFTWLAQIAPNRNLAWDCATGNGQAARDLAAHFNSVVATDASAAQIDAAMAHSRIEYRVAAAEASGLADATVDLISVAQALHWFDLNQFYAEVRRVLKPTGVLAVWTYGVFSVEDARINDCTNAFYQDTVGPFWPSERIHVESGYRTLAFPFSEIQTPQFSMETAWTLAELLGYLRSWSATGRYIAAHAIDPVDTLAKELAPMWGDAQRTRRVSWPLSVRAGRVGESHSG